MKAHMRHIYDVPGAVRRFSRALIYLTLTRMLGESDYHYPRFIDGES